MSRTRMIKPSFFKHAELYEAERESGLPLRIAFAGLWTVTDKEGRFKWKPDLKPDVLPYDNVDMMAVLSALERHGFVRRYVIAGKDYGLIPTFSDHQTFHKTERGSVLPAPVLNGGSPVRHTSDTVAVAVTGAVTQDVVVDELAEAEKVGAVNIREPALTALFLCICANKAVAARWGEQMHPYTQANTASLERELRDAGVEPEVARLSLYRQCRELNMPKPPRSVNYFRPGILSDWEAEKTLRIVAASGEAAPPPEAHAPKANGARRDTERPIADQLAEWARKTDADEAAKRGKVPA